MDRYTSSVTLLRTDQAAEFLGLKRRTWEHWRFVGGGPVYIEISPRCIRYRRSDLEAFVEERLKRSTSETT